MFEWWMRCLDCGNFEKEDTEYLGFNRLFCKQCNSRHIESGFTFNPGKKMEKPE